MEENGKYLSHFRAWDRDDSKLYTWSCLEEYPLKNKNGTFPQEYTGFKDKNDNKIYLGDIVQFRGYNTLVSFLDGSYIFKIIEPKSTMSFFWFHTVKDNTDEMEIVGNTFIHSDYLVKHLISKTENKEN